MADQEKKVKGIADIVFLVDATGSMAACIEQLKTNIGTFIDSLSGKDPNSKQVLKEYRAKSSATATSRTRKRLPWSTIPSSARRRNCCAAHGPRGRRRRR